MASFDFKKAVAEAAGATKPLLQAIVLGMSGAGKSTLMGTLPGKILYLFTTGEDHGVAAAQTNEGSDVVAICLDYADGKRLSADQTYQRLIEILCAKNELKGLGIESVAIDGASEVEALIRETIAFKNACKTKEGEHNSFREPAATMSLFRPIVQALKDLQRDLGIHFAVSCILDVKERGSDGEIESASPRLQGFSVAETVIQMFGDVLVVGEMERDGSKKHKLQFGTDLNKVSKDLKKGTVKKLLNFTPRVKGVKTPPAFMEADLKAVIKLKG